MWNFIIYFIDIFVSNVDFNNCQNQMPQNLCPAANDKLCSLYCRRRVSQEDKTGLIFITVLKRKTISMKGKTGALINFFNKDNGSCFFFRDWNVISHCWLFDSITRVEWNICLAESRRGISSYLSRLWRSMKYYHLCDGKELWFSLQY